MQRTLWKKKTALGLSLWLVSFAYILLMSWLAKESIGQNISTIGIWRNFEAHQELQGDWVLIDPRAQPLWEEIKQRYAPRLGNEPPLVDMETVDVSRGAWRSALLTQGVMVEETSGWGKTGDILLIWIEDQREVVVLKDMVAVSTFNKNQIKKNQTKKNQELDQGVTQANTSANISVDTTSHTQQFKIKHTQADEYAHKSVEKFYRPILMITNYAGKKVWFDPTVGVVFGSPKAEWKTAPALRFKHFENKRW